MEVFHRSMKFNFSTKRLLIKNSTDGNLIIADTAIHYEKKTAEERTRARV